MPDEPFFFLFFFSSFFFEIEIILMKRDRNLIVLLIRKALSVICEARWLPLDNYGCPEPARGVIICEPADSYRTSTV